MIDSIGIDIIEVSRIKKAIEKWSDSFLQRVYTPWEINYCSHKKFPEQSFAARFAVKEAVLKAIGTGYNSGIKWTSVEVVNTSQGRPTVRLGAKIQDLIGKKKIIVSMSHTREHAVANAILYEDGKS